ncbi:HNH endonuclease signature motif containing protein [Nocardioides allogilvus]|uniref:HNH endonuclease signature motif containing protein n=2 Tax=Nocardioides TaxID=1839 RepID=UPI000D311848|nr:HNH endonuclease signature motif containing protein [Nocardioides allogilvus]
MATDTVTPTAMIVELRETTATLRSAQTRVFVLAAEWADAHPDEKATTSGACIHGCPTTGLPGEDFGGGCANGCVGDPDGFDDPFIPSVRWDAPAAFGGAIGRSTNAASCLIRDALIVRHRLPRLWDRVLVGQVEPTKARMLARSIMGRPRDVADHIDTHVAHLAHKIGEVALEKKIDEAMLRLYPEQREADQLEALDRRFVRLDEASINHTGIADMAIRADWKDLFDFDVTVSRVAVAIAARDAALGLPAESLDVRRSRAIGILADPAAALALLSGDDAPAPGKRAELVLHITDTNLVGLDPVARNLTRDRAVLDQLVRDWCGRTDTHLVVQPVLDLADHDQTSVHQIKTRTRIRADLIAGTCVFPWCTRAARACDHDHIVPFDHDDPTTGGASCDCNIAPLCRHHHQLKTHAGWRYTPLERGTWLWSDPHGQQFLRDPDGTTDVTPTDHRRGTGCRHQVNRQ